MTSVPPEKSIFKSKLFWLGVISFLIGGLSGIDKTILSQVQLSYITMATGVLTIFLRTITDTKIK